MHSHYLQILFSLFALILAASLVSAQLTTNNAQSACVQYGGCTTAQGTQATATQNAPVTPPAGTPALATYTTLDSAFISSLAAAGATSAYQANGGSGGNGGTVIVTQTASGGGSGGSGGSGAGSGSSSMPTLNIGSGSSSSGASNKVLEITGLNAVVLLGGALMGAALLL